ncbi:GspH/FimT family pseudopilin [Vibrio pectenicida]|uniref:GspH/FimT family pseudopilin n=1 Tax=Vibrio pectenicida TaxID=62763 RepID=UPI003B9D4D4A
MPRGFTLLELAIVIGLISLTLLWAVPSFRSVSDTTKMTRLANELRGFVLLAKSQAILRRQSLWVHFSHTDSSWELSLTDKQDAAQGSVLMSLSGEPFKDLALSSNYSANRISFDATHGRPKSGRLVFHPMANPYLLLELRTHFRSAIVRVCAPRIARLGYGVC